MSDYECLEEEVVGSTHGRAHRVVRCTMHTKQAIEVTMQSDMWCF